MLKKIILYPLEYVSCFAFQFILHLYTSVSDDLMGVLLVQVGACDWYSSEQWPLLAGQEEGPEWQNRLAIGWH